MNWHRLGWCGVLLACMVNAADRNDTVQRQAFRQAWDAADKSLVASDTASLKSYVLYPYLQAKRWRLALTASARDSAALDESISAFMDAQGNSPVTRELRRAWLLDLAARNEWPRFLKFYKADSSDLELRCTAVTALTTTGQAAQAATQVLPLWLNAQRLPAACNEPFRWAQTADVLTADIIEQRVRLVLKAGNTDLARDLLPMLPETRVPPLKAWATALEAPLRAIDDVIAGRSTLDNSVLPDIWLRLARRDQDAAVARIEPLVTARRFSAAEASPYYVNLALTLSWARRDEAGRFFDKALPQDMTDTAREWQARAALWQQDWPRVLRTIDAMPAALKSQARWRYWSARALASRDAAAATEQYRLLATQEDNYYAALAAARLNMAYAPHPQALEVDASQLKRLSREPAAERMRELVAVQLRAQATDEWFAAQEGLDLAAQRASVKLAHEWQWYERAILSAAKLGIFNDYALLYPRPYDTDVNKAARLSGLAPELIYAQMRQESLFQPDAKSSAGALGLMQLLPTTAKQTARRAKLALSGAGDLFDPAINIPLGAVELQSMLNRAGGNLAMGLAAYNAGATAMRRWLPADSIDTDIWIENIPYNETRTYVQRIYWHRLIFTWLATGRPVDTGAWLGQIHGGLITIK